MTRRISIDGDMFDLHIHGREAPVITAVLEMEDEQADAILGVVQERASLKSKNVMITIEARVPYDSAKALANNWDGAGARLGLAARDALTKANERLRMRVAELEREVALKAVTGFDAIPEIEDTP